jgi:hypothetical protein
MRVTSPAYAPYSDVRWVDFNIRFELLDETARSAAVPTVNGQEDCSQLEQLTDGIETMSEKWATLELNAWGLDGKHKIMPDDVTGLQTGWWGDVLSDENGDFASPPTLSFYFGGAPIDTIGFMLYFDGDSYPTSIRVTTYDADQATIIQQETFSNDKHNCVIDMPVQGYYKVKFEFLSTAKPYRRVRLAECLFGIVQDFDGDSLETVYITYSADLISEAFPSRQLGFTFENLDKKYNFINPNGLYAYLQQGQDLYVKAVINGEKVDMGVFEYTSSQASDDEMTCRITANDIVLLSLESIFSGGSDTVTTLENAVDAVLDGIDIEVSLAYPSCQVSMAIPQGTTKREALRLLAQAAKCSIWIDRDGVLQIHPLVTSETEDDELNADNMYSMGGIGVLEPVDCVELTVYNEYAETQTVYTSGSGRRVKAVENPCAHNGQEVADWILAQCNRRIRYDKQNRCNPAVEIGDTLKIYDAYGENKNAIVVGQDIVFDGALSAKTKAVG